MYETEINYQKLNKLQLGHGMVTPQAAVEFRDNNRHIIKRKHKPQIEKKESQ